MTTKPFLAGSVNTTELSPSKSLSDVLLAVDQRSRAVLAAEEFAACEIRCHMLHGQWVAETDRLVELKRQLDTLTDDIVTKTAKMGPL